MSIPGKIGRKIGGLVTRGLRLGAVSLLLVALIFVLDATLSPDKREDAT
jgi:hypothetical protein